MKKVEEDFQLEDENMIGSDRKGPDNLRDEIYAVVKCIKSGQAQVWMTYQLSS